MKWDTLTERWTLFDMFLFIGLFWIINPVLAPQLFQLLIGITIGTIIVDLTKYFYNKKTKENIYD